MAEWIIATALNTVERDERSVSSNLTPTAQLTNNQKKNYMIYIKAFLRGFWSTIERFLNPKDKVDLCLSLGFYISCALITLFKGWIILGLAWLVGVWNVSMNYRFNNGHKPNKFIKVISLLLNLVIVAFCIWVLI